MPKLEAPDSEIAIVIRDMDYVAIASPVGKINSDLAIEIARFKVKALTTRAAFETWRDFVVENYRLAIASCFGIPPDELTMVDVTEKGVMN